MPPPTVSVASQAHRQRAIQTLLLGFSVDPVARWVWPDADRYVDGMTRFIGASGGRAFDHDTAYLGDNGRAAALWLPPGVDPDGEMIETVIAQTVAPERLEEVAAYFEKIDQYHPDSPCWYLPLIAADPTATGQGLGAALMKHALARCDADGASAYLESSNPRNISLYQRHGFEIIGEIKIGSSPVMTPMARAPR